MSIICLKFKALFYCLETLIVFNTIFYNIENIYKF